MEAITDSHGRTFHYLRLSVTEVCNFRCVYCLPNGYKKTIEKSTPPFAFLKTGLDAPPIQYESNELSLSEIKNLVKGFARLGFWKVRITGGEPTLRKDILEIVREVSMVPGIRDIALTTNGYRLKALAEPLRQAGLTSLNVSVDSLDGVRFGEITGTHTARFKEVMTGISIASKMGFEKIKVNAVLLKDLNDDLESFTEWVRDKNYSIRFIELMQTGENKKLFNLRYVSGTQLQMKLLKLGWRRKDRESGEGPATEFTHPKYMGRIGIIAPYAKDFCNTCNRLRVTSRGGLRLCLFGEKDYSLRQYLQSEHQLPELTHAIQMAMGWKKETHSLHLQQFGNTWNFSSIGG